MRRDVRRYAAEASRCVTQRDRVRIWKAILGAYHEEPDYRAPCPLLLMNGAYDFIVGAGLIKLLAARWAAWEPLATCAVIPLAGHNANLDNPAFTNELLMRFLREHLQADTAHAPAA